ncbi:hypothetical protein ABT294_00780 [Nonomuraea sp. NPDC000554]|uniref:hypothetical protein n=1 Tax=Nonomuraea sp. NPDC000554 TaxID=3154259 RepID=UPI00332E679E
MALDLTADLERISRHIPCLERAAADESATPAQRAAVAVELAAWRMARDLAEQARMTPDDPEHPRTEANHGEA